MTIRKVAVVGAGTMGNGIAHVCALAGLDVALLDADAGALERAMATISRNLGRQAARGRVGEEERKGALARITPGRSPAEAAGADLAIEAVPEVAELKGQVFAELDAHAPAHAILASNTSSISITEIGARTSRPERVVGMHFMNPVPVMRLVEVIRGLRTDDATTAAVMELARTLGKTPVEVRDFPGFVSNRVLMPMINEAVFALMEGVADARSIDTVMTLGMNHPMGPLALADLIGLDTCLNILEVLHREIGDDRYRPCPLLRQHVAAGWLGRKTGRGLHNYESLLQTSSPNETERSGQRPGASPVRAPAAAAPVSLLTQEQTAVRDLARDFAGAEIAPHAAAWDRERAFDPAVLGRLGELGFLGMLTPERYGGLGLDLPTFLIAFEELARGDAALSLTLHIQNGPVPLVLMNHGTEAQKARWLPAMAAGEAIAGFALSEAEAGSDPGAMSTTARRTADGWVLSGAKKWVTNGGRADVVLVFAAVGEPGADESPDSAAAARSTRPRGARRPFGAFLVDTSAPGYRPGRRERTMGLRASETVEVELDQVAVARDRLVGDPARGLSYALESLELGRLGIAMQAVGIAAAALEHAARYARERRQFGRAIADFGAVRGKLAEMAARLAAARALVLECARAWEAHRGWNDPAPDRGAPGNALPLAARSAMAKLVASETAALVTEEAVRIFGGYGFMREYPVEKLMRDAKATEIYEGTNQILRLVIGREVTRAA